MTWQGRAIAGGYEFTDTKTGARVVLDQLHPNSRGGLDAWIELYEPETSTPISFGRKDIMSPRSVDTFAASASVKRSKTVDWQSALDSIFYRVIDLHRTGSPPVDLATYEPEPFSWVVKPLIEAGGHTRLIAPGGSGKSLFALAVALTVATGQTAFLGLKPDITGPVLYLDWETDAATHARRVRALCEGADVPPPKPGVLYYQHQTVPLHRAFHSIYRQAHQLEAVLLTVDSTSLARGASGEGSAEDSTLRMFGALREIDRPALLVDHKPKEAIQKKRRGGYGSVFNTNIVRLEWEMSHIVHSPNGTASFVLTLEKSNNIRPGLRLGYHSTISNDDPAQSIRFRQIDPQDVPDPDEVPLSDQIAGLLAARNMPLTVKQIAGILSQPEGQIRARLNDDPRFVNVSTTRIGKWRLEGEPRDDGEQETIRIEDDDAPF